MGFYTPFRPASRHAENHKSLFGSWVMQLINRRVRVSESYRQRVAMNTTLLPRGGSPSDIVLGIVVGIIDEPCDITVRWDDGEISVGLQRGDLEVVQ